MNEIWKPIAGFDGYEVSNLGRVKSFHKGGRILQLSPDAKGYPRAFLYRDGHRKNFTVHRLVAEAFIPNPFNKPEVNHRNGIKTDNRVENLEWATRSENQLHACATGLQKTDENSPTAKLTNEQVRFVRDNPDNFSIDKFAEMFGVNRSTIYLIQLGKTYKNAGGTVREAKPSRSRVPDDVRNEIRRLFVKGSSEFGASALAKKYGVCPSTILNIVRER